MNPAPPGTVVMDPALQATIAKTVTLTFEDGNDMAFLPILIQTTPSNTATMDDTNEMYKVRYRNLFQLCCDFASLGCAWAPQLFPQPKVDKLPPPEVEKLRAFLAAGHAMRFGKDHPTHPHQTVRFSNIAPDMTVKCFRCTRSSRGLMSGINYYRYRQGYTVRKPELPGIAVVLVGPPQLVMHHVPIELVEVYY
uniref:PAZ domain-containing protein n=1 Tax=Panagrellus redivivus TaxID=6233 RepID=A0A7E4V702_PANRE